jgi:hypothetical protein
MAAKYKKLITDYCEANGITVPPGFARNTPSRYAIIRTHQTPPKLIATTWFAVADVVYYIQHHLAAELGDGLSVSIQILDFETAEILAYNGSKQLNRIGTFPLA